MGADKANGILITASRQDADANDMAGAISNAIMKDGQSTITADIPLSGHKPTGLAAP